MKKHKTLPQFNNYEQASEWLDSHSTADLKSTEVHFEVASPLHLQIIDSLNEIEETIVVEKRLSRQIQQIAQKEGVSTHVLIHKWLQEKVKNGLKSH
ncbi:MAG: hypothetical protein ACE5HI_08010 [bacterium]